MTKISKKKNGFSLIEMAVVMLIMGSLLSGLLVALTQTSDNTRRTTAKNQLIKIEEALYAFARANGRLPCPATSASDGYESPNGTGDCNDNDATTFGIHGFVPAATLSLYGRINGDGLLLDPWSNPYRYSISSYEVDSNGNWVNEGTGDEAFTKSAALNSLFSSNASMNTGTPAIGIEDATDHVLWVCDDNTCGGDIYSQISPAVVFSMGNNWTDMIADCGVVVNTDEVENAGAISDGGYCLTNTNIFVDAEYNEDSFDDILIWLSPYVLFSRMIDAAQLP